MINRLIALSVLLITLIWISAKLPEKLMLVDLEYIMSNNPPSATYNNNNKAYDAIVRLLHKGMFVCSAVIVSEEYALTAAHCISNNGKISHGGYVLANKEETYFAPSIIAFAYGYHDIALLYGNYSAFHRKAVDWTGQLLNNKMAKSCGYPQGQTALLCNDYEILGNKFFFLRGNGHIFQGQSGGPVMVGDIVIGVNSHVSFSTVMAGPVVGMQEMFRVF